MELLTASRRHRYAIALGGNRRTRHGGPAQTLAAALARIGGVTAVSPIFATPPLGPSTRRFANAAALVESDLPPPAMLARLKAIERAMGRRPGRRWGARPVDLDIILWSGGRWRERTLTVPHPAFRSRRFVLEPLATIAPDWRDPADGLSVRQLLARTRRRR
jgi:2-amino-4-hydroxy-6-hydroxymethyldihydropteridine diphosphokinase